MSRRSLYRSLAVDRPRPFCDEASRSARISARPGRAAIIARDIGRRAASVPDHVERGEHLVVTGDGEPTAEIIPIDRSQRAVAC